jgi:hypothetical protein
MQFASGVMAFKVRIVVMPHFVHIFGRLDRQRLTTPQTGHFLHPCLFPYHNLEGSLLLRTCVLF